MARPITDGTKIRVGGYLSVPWDTRSGDLRRVRVMAVKGVWVLHRSFGWQAPGFSITHVPTRLMAIGGLRLSVAKRALRAFAAQPGRWTFTDPAQLTQRQKRAGAKLKVKLYVQDAKLTARERP